MSFARPELLWLTLAAPVAALVAWAALRRRRRAEQAWVGSLLEPRMRSGGRPRASWVAPLLLAVATLGVALSLARPRWGTSTETVERRGLDIVFVVDTSASMGSTDVAPSRFWLAQSLVRRLAQALPGHRVALVAAEGEGEVMAPLTVDSGVLDLVLDSLQPGSLAIPGTRLTAALERAVRLFPPGSETHRAIVLLSDGEDHGGELDRAIAALRSAGVVVATIGIGTRQGAPVPLSDGSGYKRDGGDVVISRLHPEVLQQLAQATDGVYSEAHDPRFEPTAVTTRLAAMGGRRLEQTTVSLLEERFQWPLALAASALALALLLSPWRRPLPEAT